MSAEIKEYSTSRKLATVRRIAEVQSIDGADRIVKYRCDGWWVIDQKDKYKVGDLVIYAEPDSWVPHTLASFLTKTGAYPKVFNNVEGQRLKTRKIKQVYSQGLLFKLEEVFNLSRCGKYIESPRFANIFDN